MLPLLMVKDSYEKHCISHVVLNASLSMLHPSVTLPLVAMHS